MANYVVAGLAVGAVVLIYQAGANKIAQRGAYTDYAAGQDGNDPTWNGGPAIEVTNPQSQKKPACKVWNNDVGAYLYAGNAEWDKSESACFAALGTSWGFEKNSYTDKDGNVTYKTLKSSDPFDFSQNPAADYGTCLFDEKNGPPSYKPASAPVNRNQQVCFAAQPGGTAFKRGGIVRGFNPRATVTPSMLSRFNFTNTPGNNQTLIETLPTNRCEEFIGFLDTANPFPAWGYTTKSSQFDKDMTGCLARAVYPTQNTSATVKTRYVQGNSATFRNPYDNSLMTMDLTI